MISDDRIDAGKAFDWGRVSDDYALYRDIYPEDFYRRIVEHGLCIKGQRVLDIGTGTGVLPRNMYKYGAEFIGTDISGNQIAEAKKLSEKAGQSIRYYTMSAEELDFPAGSFDVITACQCFFYFRHEVVLHKLAELLRPDGKLVLLYMAWLPYEDEIAGKSEQLILKYNPQWSGAGETRHPIWTPDIMDDYFTLEHSEVYDLDVPFTRESWNGRMRACRGVGASLSAEEIALWEREHIEMLKKIAPEQFDVKHYAAMKIFGVNH